MHWRGNYALALALVAGIVAVVIVVLTAVGTEAKGVAFGKTVATAPAATAIDPS
jgi:MFS transporter, SHS family, lactate transporter